MNDEFDSDFLEKKLSVLIFKLSKDKISNIRMNSACLLKKMLKICKSKDVLKESHSCIEELKRDTDVDVVNIISDY